MAIEIMMLREAESVEPGEPVVLEKVPVCCPACRSSRFKKNGTRRRTRRGMGQRYRCLNPDCRKGFTGDLGFGGRHVSPEAILMALMIFSMGVSPDGIVLVLDQRMKIKVHRTTTHVNPWRVRDVIRTSLHADASRHGRLLYHSVELAVL